MRLVSLSLGWWIDFMLDMVNSVDLLHCAVSMVIYFAPGAVVAVAWLVVGWAGQRHTLYSTVTGLGFRRL